MYWYVLKFVLGWLYAVIWFRFNFLFGGQIHFIWIVYRGWVFGKLGFFAGGVFFGCGSDSVGLYWWDLLWGVGPVILRVLLFTLVLLL